MDERNVHRWNKYKEIPTGNIGLDECLDTVVISFFDFC